MRRVRLSSGFELALDGDILGVLEALYRVRLERNEVSGGPEMVVYRFARCTV